MESSLSLDELITTVEAIRKKENEDKKFIAAINGVDLDGETEVNDITDLKSSRVAANEGFGVGEGLGFMEMGEDEWQE